MTLVQKEVKKIYLGGTQVRPALSPSVLFNYGDWTTSTRSDWRDTQGTITKTASYITFSRSGGYSAAQMTGYQIDGTRDFLLEFNAILPSNHNGGTQVIGLVGSGSSVIFVGVRRQHSGYLDLQIDSTWVNGDLYSTPTAKDFFIKKEGTVVTVGWDGATKYTYNNFSSDATYYLSEQVYMDTTTMYTAKLTYLS